jgi:hypothetical protein
VRWRLAYLAAHPAEYRTNLPELYRRKVEALEQALSDPAMAAAAIEALRSLIDAILVHPGARRGEVRIELRGDLAAFMHLTEDGSLVYQEDTRTIPAAST